MLFCNTLWKLGKWRSFLQNLNFAKLHRVKKWKREMSFFNFLISKRSVIVVMWLFSATITYPSQASKVEFFVKIVVGFQLSAVMYFRKNSVLYAWLGSQYTPGGFNENVKNVVKSIVNSTVSSWGCHLSLNNQFK